MCFWYRSATEKKKKKTKDVSLFLRYTPTLEEKQNVSFLLFYQEKDFKKHQYYLWMLDGGTKDYDEFEDEDDEKVWAKQKTDGCQF